MSSGSIAAVVTASRLTSPVRPRSATADSRPRTTEAAPSLMPEALPAVTEPSLAKAGRRPARVSRVVSGLGCSSLSAVKGLRPPTSKGVDLLGEGCLRLGGRRAALRLEGELVLLLAGDAVLLRDVFRRDAHVDAVEGVGEHEDGAVLQLAVAELVAAAGTEVVEGHPGHRLVAAGEGEVEVVPPHLHRGGPDRLQARAAQAVDRVGGDVGRQAGRDGDATRVVGVGADLADAAHDDLGDVLARDTGALQRHPAGLGAELEARHVLEHPAEASGRGTGAVDDDDLLGAHQLLRGRWVRSEVSIPPRPSRSLRRSSRDRLTGP
ncbi:hypothetical protein B277_15194 [Janibacter hoylei PVAS-1]|uniref:Uncharacterized protein n=1 Tax=Janibacter hoylei PVAS-1 TaxID=1210046 RepID=K1DU22_9MICO|nr:hypothetical protein B277_15194 [Janibacter hoylei PVAS-1]